MINVMWIGKKVGIGLAVVLVAAALAIAFILGLFTPEPAEVSLAETVAAVEAAQTQAAIEAAGIVAQARADEAAEQAEAAATVAADLPEATTAPVPTIEVPTGSTFLAGAWDVEQGDNTFAGYRADSPTGEAVGRSSGVQGQLIANDTEVLAVDITVDMKLLASDSRFRDEHLGTEGLETQRFGTSQFVLVEPIPITVDVADGATLVVEAEGLLTVKEIAQPVTIELEGTMAGDRLVVVGSTAIDLNDFEATISSIEKATMEFSLVFAPQS